MCLSLSSRLSITASPTAPRFLPEINLRTPVLFKLIRRADRRAAFLFSSTFFNGLQVLRFSRRYRFALRGFSLGCFFFFFELVTSHDTLSLLLLLLAAAAAPALLAVFLLSLNRSLLRCLSPSVVPSVLSSEPSLFSLVFLPFLLRSLSRFFISDFSRCHGSPSSCQALFLRLAHFAVAPDLSCLIAFSPQHAIE